MQQIPDLEKAVREHENRYPQFNTFDTLKNGLICLSDIVKKEVVDLDRKPLGPQNLVLLREPNPAFDEHPLIQEASQRLTSPVEMLEHHYIRGTNMLNANRFETAEHDFKYCVRLIGKLGITPKSVVKSSGDVNQQYIGNIFNQYGYTLMLLKRIGEAIDVLHQALLFNPQQPFANYNLGDCYRTTGNKSLARSFYEEELKVNPNHPTVRQRLIIL